MSAASLPTTFDPATAEQQVSRRWEQANCFHAQPRDDAPPYTIVIPPPNVTGALHMGHALDNLPQDFCIRYRRMKQHNTCWLPGLDHAGIATQAIVERLLLEQEGISRHDIGRSGLLERIWAWKERYGSRILEQLRKLGCSCDWLRTRFTMDPVCSAAVREAFFRLFSDGLVYRGKRLVNWDCHLQTAVADDEIENVEQLASFYYIRYPLHPDFATHTLPHVTVATTRPETMLGDVAVAVCPEPRRVLEHELHAAREELAQAPQHTRDLAAARVARAEERIESRLPMLEALAALARRGATLLLPLTGRSIPLIADHWADPLKGSGAVKITPAHDPNDYLVGSRHNLEPLNILTASGEINEHGQGQFEGRSFSYTGLDRFEARKRIVQDLEQLGLLESVEQISNSIPLSDRSKTIIEPYLSEQWFVRMGDSNGRPGLAQRAIDAVHDGSIQFFPQRYARTYTSWLDEKRDWCISRQLWWGHRIPVWTLDNIGPAAPALLQEFLDRTGIAHHVAVRPAGNAALQLCPRNQQADQALEALACVVDRRADCPTATTFFIAHPGALDPANALAAHASSLRQDEDVLDTWFSSGLWPLSLLHWPDETPEMRRWYPHSVLICGRGIITLWVARMVIFGLYLRGQVPFRHVHIHANVLDGEGVTMSKSRGNGIDPIELIDRYGCDALRYTLAEMMTGLQDIRLPVQLVCPHCGHVFPNPTGKEPIACCPACGKPMTRPLGIAVGTPEAPLASVTSERFEAGRNFANKLWNAGRFVLINLEGAPPSGEPAPPTHQPPQRPIEDRWILSRACRLLNTVEQAIEQYQFADAIEAFRAFFWAEFCDWYLELAKPRIAEHARANRPDPLPDPRPILSQMLDLSLHLLHPFCPFITETLHAIHRPHAGLLAVSPWPQMDPQTIDPDAEAAFEQAAALVRAAREIRSTQNVPPARRLHITVARAAGLPDHTQSTIQRFLQTLAAADTVRFVETAESTDTCLQAVAGDLLLIVHDVVDQQAARLRREKRRDELRRSIAALEARLANHGYIQRAPPHLVQQTRDSLQKAHEELTLIEQAAHNQDRPA